jgi:transposase
MGISHAMPPGRHAVLMLDQAGWHTTHKLRQFPNVSLLSLPIRSPELNPAEQVWQQLHARDLANRCYDSLDHILMPGARPGINSPRFWCYPFTVHAQLGNSGLWPWNVMTRDWYYY